MQWKAWPNTLTPSAKKKEKKPPDGQFHPREGQKQNQEEQKREREGEIRTSVLGSRKHPCDIRQHVVPGRHALQQLLQPRHVCALPGATANANQGHATRARATASKLQDCTVSGAARMLLAKPNLWKM
jgi:hypothetical protein